MTSSAPKRSTPPMKPEAGTTGYRVVGLDGLRAIAVVLVILYHLSPGAAIGGYLGVDVFFVVSGFLITTLLLREHDASGRIRLGAFWMRRARRLLPALAALLLVCCSTALLVGGDALVALGRQVLGALTFSTNWLLLASGSSYFGDTLPELFRNLWSLAVEEQFYLVWPLLLMLLLLRIPRWLRLALVALLAVASAFAMWLLVDPADTTRAYYGTDTQAFGLAIGALLAFVTTRRGRAPAWPRAARIALPAAGTLAVGGLVALALVMPGDAVITFRGGLILVAILTAMVIAGLLVPRSPLGRVLETAPFRWVGKRSYGLYLWHWPVFVLMAGALPTWPRDGLGGWALGGVAAAVTVAAAAVSYRFVEEPIRRHGWRATAVRVGGLWRGSWKTAAGVAAVTALVLAAGTGSVLAITRDPGTGQTQQQVQAGQQAIAQAQRSASPTPMPSAPAQPIGGDQVSAIGDSVTLAAAPELEAALPGISIDAQVSRQMSAAPGIVQEELASGTLRKVLVLALGTNGPVQRSTLEQIRALIGPERELVLVNVQAPRGWTDGVNQTLSGFAQSYRNVVLANWHDTVQPHLAELNRDQIHFGGAGGRLFTGVVEDALQQLAELPPLRDEQDDQSLPVPV